MFSEYTRHGRGPFLTCVTVVPVENSIRLKVNFNSKKT